MFCKNCGCEVREEAKFCPICGTALKEEKVEAEVIFEEAAPVKKQAKCWTIFCKVAFILGFLSFIPFVGLGAGPAGIVFAILGARSNNTEYQHKRKVGLACSIIGFVISLIIFIVLYVIALIAILEESGYYY